MFSLIDNIGQERLGLLTSNTVLDLYLTYVEPLHWLYNLAYFVSLSILLSRKTSAPKNDCYTGIKVTWRTKKA